MTEVTGATRSGSGVRTGTNIFPPSQPTTTSPSQATTEPPAATTTTASTKMVGLTSYTFYATPGASATNTQMSKAGPNVALAVGMPYRGTIVSLTLNSDTTKTAGSCVFTARVSGTATTATLTWATGTRTATSRFVPNTVGFVRDDTLDVVFTTDSTFLPTTAKLEICVVCIVSLQETTS